MGQYLLSIRRAEDLDGPPIFMTSDQRVIAAAVEALLDQLGQSDHRVLKLQRALDPNHGATP